MSGPSNGENGQLQLRAGGSLSEGHNAVAIHREQLSRIMRGLQQIQGWALPLLGANVPHRDANSAMSMIHLLRELPHIVMPWESGGREQRRGTPVSQKMPLQQTSTEQDEEWHLGGHSKAVSWWLALCNWYCSGLAGTIFSSVVPTCAS